MRRLRLLKPRLFPAPTLLRLTDWNRKKLFSRKPGFGPVCFFYAGRYARHMKACLLAMLATLLFGGCNDSSQTNTSSSSGNKSSVNTAPAEYLNRAAKAQKRAVKTVDVTAMNKAIESFYVQQGRFPKDLLELVEKGLLPRIPELPDKATWVYDSKNGVVSIQRN